jgi:hypothetical protein
LTTRRFPPPWSVEELDAGQALAYVYFEDEPGRRSAAKIIGPGRGETDYLNFGQSRAQYSPEGAAIKPRSIC